MRCQARFAGRWAVLAALVVLAASSGALAQEPRPSAKGAEPSAHEGTSEGELAKAVQNPVANLISVPFQNNIDFGIGPFYRVRNTLNIQPVVPVSLSERWNLINRVILPLIYQPDVTQVRGGTFGLGDTSVTFFLSPAKPGALIWGVGPALLLPTATSDVLGTGKWSVGPSVVLAVQPAPWTLGVLAQNVWSFAGEGDRAAVNQFLLQYFINYNLPNAWYLTSAPILTANWKAPSENRWVIPFGAGIGKVLKLGSQPVNGSVSAYYNVVSPDNPSGPDWQLRFQLALLFPEGHGGKAQAP